MWFSFVSHLSYLSAAVPFLFGLFRGKHLARDLKIIVALAAVSLVADTAALLLATHRINTWPVGNLFLMTQAVLLFYVWRKQHSALVNVLFYACIAFGVINFLFGQGRHTFDQYTIYLTGIILIATVLYFFYLLIQNLPAERVQSLPLFWIAIAVLVYYGGTIFVFLFNNYFLTQLTAHHPAMWTVHNIINIAKNILFFIALWVNDRSNHSHAAKA